MDETHHHLCIKFFLSNPTIKIKSNSLFIVEVHLALKLIHKHSTLKQTYLTELVKNPKTNTHLKLLNYENQF